MNWEGFHMLPTIVGFAVGCFVAPEDNLNVKGDLLRMMLMIMMVVVVKHSLTTSPP